MLALSTGAQYQFMAQKKCGSAKQISDAMGDLGISGFDELYSPEASSATDTLTSLKMAPFGSRDFVLLDAKGANICSEDVSRCLSARKEKSRLEAVTTPNFLLPEAKLLLYQLVSDDSDQVILEQWMAFLGCGMECVRSSFGSWVENNPNVSESVGTPSLRQIGSEMHTCFAFRASDAFARCMQRKDWEEAMGERYVQIRLLWELQNYFLNLLPEEGISPDHQEAIILCLLTFPAVICRAEENEENEASCINTVHDVSIEVHQQKKKVSVSLFVPLGPQRVHAAANIRRRDEGDIEVSISLRREGRFVWEKWRNNFTSSLAKRREWQMSTGMESTTVSQTKGSIASGLRSATVVAFGTGDTMNVWLGWLPIGKD